jgi:hypothetical protein
MTITARALLDFASQDYKSKAERHWAANGPLLIADEFFTAVAVTLYEPISFSLPGGRYTPDFLHILATGEMVFVEIKATRKQKNYRDARSKLRAAAELYPYFYFVEAMAPSKARPSWSLDHVGKPASSRPDKGVARG